jgi:hypothetical protein
VYRTVHGVLSAHGPVEVRTTKSQVAFRAGRAFAWLWMPGRWLRDPPAEVVLSVALPRRDASPRWREVVEPRPGRWMHHLLVPNPSVVDAEVEAWLAEARGAAGGGPASA